MTEVERLRDSLFSIKGLCVGDACSHGWARHLQTTRLRMRIADICDNAIASLQSPPASPLPSQEIPSRQLRGGPGGEASEVERRVRERLENNGRNSANNGIRVGSDLHLCEMLLKDIDQLRAALQRAKDAGREEAMQSAEREVAMREALKRISEAAAISLEAIKLQSIALVALQENTDD